MNSVWSWAALLQQVRSHQENYFSLTASLGELSAEIGSSSPIPQLPKASQSEDHDYDCG